MAEPDRTSVPEEDRRAKLARLREQGVDPYPHEFEGVVPSTSWATVETSASSSRAVSS